MNKIVPLEFIVERNRQVQAEDWSFQHDDFVNSGGELLIVAMAYYDNALSPSRTGEPSVWPENWVMEDWWKPTTPARDLEKAGALCLAELERLHRKGTTKGAIFRCTEAVLDSCIEAYAQIWAENLAPRTKGITS